MESTESRFAHLLQPIRELTKNWDIDVASELNDYLEELDEMCITFDGGNTRLNFAEAALLIQGSACIYSKKVELLHSLVYQTLEYINDKNKKRSKQSASQEGGDGAAGDDDGDDVAVFTPLDLDVSEEQQEKDAIKAAQVTPLPPESLIPPETREKHKLPLISVRGEILCSVKDFRINIFIPGDEDMILLRLDSAASRLLVEEHLEPPDAASPAGGHDVEDDFLPIEENHMEVEQQQEQQQDQLQEHVERHQAPSEGRMLRERRQVEEDKQQQKEAEPAVNVWALHDPYAALGEDTPFRSGKCYRVPDGLDDGGKRKRKRAGALQEFRSWFRGAFEPAERRLKNGPACPDLNYVYLSTMKDKLKTRKRIYRKAGVVVSDEELRRTFLQPEEAGPQQQGEEHAEGFRQPDLLGGDDDLSDNEQEAFPDDGPAFAGGPDFISAETQRDELSYEDLVKLRVEQLVVNSRGYTQETALSQRVKDWEEQIQPELRRQEELPVFDIHDYGDRIVASLGAVGRRRPFSSVVAGLDNFEACKYLLASLQLANDYTVEVDASGLLEDSVDTMGLTLLSTLKATDRFKTLSE